MDVCEYVCSTYLNTRAALMRSPGAEATRSAGTGASEDGGLRREDDLAGFMQVADSRICPKIPWRIARCWEVGLVGLNPRAGVRAYLLLTVV